MGLLWQLFSTFFFIGLLNFGGGGAMISLIQGQVVTLHGWLTEGAFTDIVAISQSTPGPMAINCATYVGYEVMKTSGYGQLLAVFGSAVSTLAVVLPSFLVFFVVIRLFNKYHNSPVYACTMSVLRPAVAGLIAAAALILIISTSWNGGTPTVTLIRDNFPDWKSWLLFGAAFALSYLNKAGPITIILAGGVLGLLIY